MLDKMSCFYEFFAKIDVGWVNMATILGAILSLGISLYAIYFSKKLSDESAKVDSAIASNTEAIQKQNDAIQLQTDATHRHTKVLRLDNLRNLYELSRGDDRRHHYWHFRWRFETYDCLGVQINKVDDTGEVYLGSCDLLIQGFSNRADHIGFEGRESEFYIAKIGTIAPTDGQTFPFHEGELVACFDQQGQLKLSKGVDPWTTETCYDFSIGGMGNNQIWSGERTVETMQSYPRIKDS